VGTGTGTRWANSRDGVSGFGRIRRRVGFSFGWIRVDSEQPRSFFGVCCSLYGHFDPTEMASGYGRMSLRVGFWWIRADSWTPEMESANPGKQCQAPPPPRRAARSCCRTRGQQTKPSTSARRSPGRGPRTRPARRGLHSLTSPLNLSAFYGIGGARRDCAARVKGVFRECRVFSCVRHGSS
jgi:hypothetical protein